MKRIGVLTSDFSLYHDLVALLRGRGLAFTTMERGARPDANVGVILTSWRDSVAMEFPEDLPVVAVSVDREGKEDIQGALEQALRALEGVHGYREVVIGIDPGHRPGIAVLADGRLRHAGQVYRVRDVAKEVATLLGLYPHDRAIVRVGHGAPPERDEILRTLWPMRESGLRLELVDETGSTPETGEVRLPSDVAAAIRIARVPGRALQRPPRRVNQGRSPPSNP